MVNLNSACRQPDCYLTPGFGVRGSPATYCSKHKKANMINVISKRCENESCDRIPSYNFDAAGAKAIFCNTHKTEGVKMSMDPLCAPPFLCVVREHAEAFAMHQVPSLRTCPKYKYSITLWFVRVLSTISVFEAFERNQTPSMSRCEPMQVTT